MANSNKPRKTPNQIEYAHQLSLLKQRMSRAEKSGFRFVEQVIPTTPDRIYKRDIQAIKELRGNKLYAHTTYLDENTGKVFEGVAGAKIKRKNSAKKANIKKQKKNENYPNGGNIIANNFMDDFVNRLDTIPSDDYDGNVDDLVSELNQPEPSFVPYTKRLARELGETLRAMRQSKTTLLSLTYSVMAEIGKSALGWRLQERANDVGNALDVIVYRGSSAEAVLSACSEVASIIKGSALTMSEKQDLGEQEEYNEYYELPE